MRSGSSTCGPRYAYPQTLDLLHDPATRIIRLKRRNLLALHVAVLFVGASGVVGHSFQGDYTVERVRVDIDHCLSDIHNCHFTDLLLDDLVRANDVAQVTYEELVAEGGGDVLRRLQAFVGVEPIALESQHRRMRTRPLHDAVENWDEVQRALRGTPWEPFLDDDR